MKREIKQLNLSDIKLNDKNPRTINKRQLDKLVKSVQEFPEMTELRPIVVDENNTILGGNMRYRAMQKLGKSAAEVVKVSGLTDEQKREFIIKDNVAFGDWDRDALANEWDTEQLGEWGLDIPGTEATGEEVNRYTKKTNIPQYEITGKKPKISELYDLDKYNELIKDIEQADISDEVKQFLELSASRHIVFNYRDIAEYYAHADKEVQHLMEDSALVIIDYDDAIKDGFVRLSEDVIQMESEDDER